MPSVCRGLVDATIARRHASLDRPGLGARQRSTAQVGTRRSFSISLSLLISLTPFCALYMFPYSLFRTKKINKILLFYGVFCIGPCAHSCCPFFLLSFSIALYARGSLVCVCVSFGSAYRTRRARWPQSPIGAAKGRSRKGKSQSLRRCRARLSAAGASGDACGAQKEPEGAGPVCMYARAVACNLRQPSSSCRAVVAQREPQEKKGGQRQLAARRGTKRGVRGRRVPHSWQ